MRKKNFELSRIVHPGQHGVQDPNLWKAAESSRFAVVVSIRGGC
jgi:hypothetical protein